jgi:hypothetical protein
MGIDGIDFIREQARVIEGASHGEKCTGAVIAWTVEVKAILAESESCNFGQPLRSTAPRRIHRFEYNCCRTISKRKATPTPVERPTGSGRLTFLIRDERLQGGESDDIKRCEHHTGTTGDASIGAPIPDQAIRFADSLSP